VRIAIATQHRDHVGGVETYLERLTASLTERQHAVIFFHEFGGGPTPIALPGSCEVLDVSAAGRAAALDALATWAPDVAFVHGLTDARLEAGLIDLAPTVFMLHTYHGTCVGGTKTHAFPSMRPCTRQFGTGCLAQYFPRRCGGLSPITMFSRYTEEAAHHALFPRYAAVAVLSEHMRLEAMKHTINRDRITVLPPPIDGATHVASAKRPADSRDRRVRLLFLGRLEPAKGGHVLIAAAPAIARALGRGVEVTFAGDGRSRSEWELLAHKASSDPNVAISFVGRVDARERDRWFEWADLLVVPSLWPEPFGLVGAEAAAAGVPAVAFDVGGTRDWLDDGRTGRLADAGRLDSSALAEAIVSIFSAPGRRDELARAARAHARGWSMAAHCDAVEELLRRAALRQAA
jgi:glycosyltransferase involved in cell wall biosynthesis